MALLLSCLVLVSCKGGGDGGETSGDGTDSGSDATKYEPMDFASMDLSPYISLGQYKNVPVTVKESEYLVSLREIMKEDNAYFSFVTDGTYEPKGGGDAEIVVDETRTVAECDIINVDYTGYLNGVKFDGGQASSQDITVYETGTYIDGFASGFIGTAVGETSSFNVTFPENYGSESLAGKEVTFEFTVNYIYEFDELTDEIASDLSGGQYETVSEYEDHLRTILVQQYLWVEVVDNATVIKYPEQQVLYYYSQNRAFYEYYASYYSMEYEELLTAMGMTDDSLYNAAVDTVEDDLVYYAILKAEGITLSDDEFDAGVDVYIERYMEDLGYTEEEVREKLLDDIRTTMLYDKLQETLVKWANVIWEE